MVNKFGREVTPTFLLQLCDVISKWETALREKGSGKFETTRVIRLIFKNRLYFKSLVKKESDRERLLLCYQVNQQVVQGRFPLTKELALELAALMAQVRRVNFKLSVQWNLYIRGKQICPLLTDVC